MSTAPVKSTWRCGAASVGGRTHLRTSIRRKFAGSIRFADGHVLVMMGQD
jgi:hypothetical protein